MSNIIKSTLKLNMIFFLSSICILGCATYDKKCTSFIENVDMEKLLVFSENSVWPNRSDTYLINSYIIDKYDTSSIKNLKIIGDYGFRLKDLTEPEIHDIYKKYKELDVLIISGSCRRFGYIQIVISPKLVVVYICDKKKFDLDDYVNSFSVDTKSITKYDESWFYYKLPKGEYYNSDP